MHTPGPSGNRITLVLFLHEEREERIKDPLIVLRLLISLSGFHVVNSTPRRTIVEYLRLRPPEGETVAGLQIAEDDLGGAKEHGIDLIEIMVIALKDRRERRAIIG